MGYMSRQPTSNEPEQPVDEFFMKLCGKVKCEVCGRWFLPKREVRPYLCAMHGGQEAEPDPPNVGCASGEDGEAD